MWVSFNFIAALFFLSGDDWTGSLVQEVDIFFSIFMQWKNILSMTKSVCLIFIQTLGNQSCDIRLKVTHSKGTVVHFNQVLRSD